MNMKFLNFRIKKLFNFTFFELKKKQILIRQIAGLLIIIFFTSSCKEETKSETNFATNKEVFPPRKITKDESIAISQLWTKDESYKIKRFVERRSWNAKRTETGMYYYIYVSNKEGRKAKAGDIASIEFKIRLLNADTTLCYSSEIGKTEDVMIEMANVESGLHEALTYLREGEKAYVILPHYLAHGLAGDLDRIPPLSPVLYEINLVELK